jgi:hypothetical protein
MWCVPNIWEGGEAWIIGGGPSITEQFNIPKKIVQAVVEGTATPSAYSPYLAALHNKHIIGVNVAYKLGDWIDFVFFGDHSFFLREKRDLAAFAGTKVTIVPQCEKYSWIKYVARDEKHRRGISPDPSKVSWNGNSGAAAISLAAHLGAKKIYLLGFDMKLGDNKVQHWHDLYHRNDYLKSTPVDKIGLPFDRHLLGFPKIAEDAKRMKIKIINVCPDSAINDFPKVALSEVLQIQQLVTA